MHVSEKHQIYRDLVEATTISSDTEKEALAFLVEAMVALDHASLLKELVVKIKECSKSTARELLDKQISTCYQQVLVQKIRNTEGETKKYWEQTNRLYQALIDSNAKCKEKFLGGIDKELVPEWYTSK